MELIRAIWDQNGVYSGGGGGGVRKTQVISR